MKEQIYLKSPVGYLLITASTSGVESIHFCDEQPKVAQLSTNKHLQLAGKELRAYFQGRLTCFSFKLNPTGTDFQKRVWRALQKVEFGKTCSYGDLAKEIGSPKASRAVGGANNKNPLPIVVPCHRVVGRSGKLVGYAGGLRRKWLLLKHEQEVETMGEMGFSKKKIAKVSFGESPND